MSNKDDQILFLHESYELAVDEIADRVGMNVAHVQQVLDDHICSQWEEYNLECAGCEFDDN